jgi:hypothetical protein
MGTRTFLKRIEQAEKALKTQSIFSPHCICFPEKERPSFGFPIEMEIAGRVKCPLHGERFTPLFHLYVPIWLREKLWSHLSSHSDQYRKAWCASFPPELWPAEEETENDNIFLRLKDGTRLLAYDGGRGACLPRGRTIDQDNARRSVGQGSTPSTR